MEARDGKDAQKQPMAIYECHVGSFMKHPDGAEGFYNYREFADKLADYLGSALYIFLPSLAVIRNLYSSPVATPGMKSPQMPTGPSFSIGWTEKDFAA